MLHSLPCWKFTFSSLPTLLSGLGSEGRPKRNGIIFVIKYGVVEGLIFVILKRDYLNKRKNSFITEKYF